MAAGQSSPTSSLFSGNSSATSLWSEHSSGLLNHSVEIASHAEQRFGDEVSVVSPSLNFGLSSRTVDESDLFLVTGDGQADRSCGCRMKLPNPGVGSLDCAQAIGSHHGSLVTATAPEPVLLRTIGSTISAFMLSPIYSPSGGIAHRRPYFGNVDELDASCFGDNPDAFGSAPNLGIIQRSLEMSAPSQGRVKLARRSDEIGEASVLGKSNLFNVSSSVPSPVCCIPKHPIKSRSFSSKLKRIARKFRIRLK